MPCIALRAADAIRLDFDFAQSDHGFLAGFADYPQNADSSQYQLTNSWQARPTNLGGVLRSLHIGDQSQRRSVHVLEEADYRTTAQYFRYTYHGDPIGLEIR